MKNNNMKKMKKNMKGMNMKSNTLTEMAEDLKDIVASAKKKIMKKMK